jgi:hypothetical protein
VWREGNVFPYSAHSILSFAINALIFLPLGYAVSVSHIDFVGFFVY